MKKYIHITKSDREFIAKAFGCTDRMVLKAIHFERGSTTQLCDKIRHLAMERGGIMMVVTPAMETLYDHDGYMHQYFPNGAMIEVGTTPETAGIAVYDKKGVKVLQYPDVCCSELQLLQQRVAMWK